MKKVILGLGSSSGDRLSYLRQAVYLLKSTQPSCFQVLSTSPIYESQAMLPLGAPQEWDQPYLNLCLLAHTTLHPTELLSFVKSIEVQLGRKQRERWAPREIDLDLLAIEEETFQSEELQIPHPGLTERPFALLPLTDLAPEWRYPGRSGPDSNTQTGASETAFQLSRKWAGESSQIPFQTRRTGHFLTELVGIVNVTPDSFSDGGLYLNPESAIRQAQELVRAGATVLDIGAESTRPGAQTISPDAEWDRLKPILSALIDLSHDGIRPTLSIDTRNASTARHALALGVHWVNDVSGANSLEMQKAVAESAANYVVMHSLSVPPRAGETLPLDQDPTEFLLNWGNEKIKTLEANGISRSRIIFDPGIGFGKTLEQNLALLRNSQRFQELGVRILIGHSRKSFITKPSAETALLSPKERDLETGIISEALAKSGVDYLRIHDVSLHQRILSTSALLSSSKFSVGISR